MKDKIPSVFKSIIAQEKWRQKQIAIYYGKNPILARLVYIKVVINKFLGRLLGFSRIIKLKNFLNYSSNWK